MGHLLKLKYALWKRECAYLSFNKRPIWYVQQIRTEDYCFIILGPGGSGNLLDKYGGGFFLLECYRVLWPKPVFLNVYGAQESIPRNEFRQPM